MRVLILGLAAMFAAPALAADNMVLSSTILVEKTVNEGGRAKTVYEPPKLVTPGQKLLFVLDYRNAGAKPATDFVVTNPLPAAVAFEDSVDREATVSVDGGKNWGALAALRVRQADGSARPAQPADVTHIRWTIANAVPVGGSGKLSFRGTVR